MGLDPEYKDTPKTISIDIDNTVNDFIFQFVSCLNGLYTKEDYKMFVIDDMKDYRLSKCTGISDHILETLFFKNNEFYKTMSPLIGSTKIIRNMVSNWHCIRFVTSINYEVVQSRIEFIRQHFPFIDVDKQLIVTNDKSSISADILIDDCPYHIGRNVNPECRYVVYDQPWNRDIVCQNEKNNCYRVSDWIRHRNSDDAIPTVEELFKQWELI